MSGTPGARRDGGFSLIEVLVATGVVAVGVLGLAGVMNLGARRLLGSQDELLASQRATEAIECVVKARDSRVLTWSQIRNVKGGSGNDQGVFHDGADPLRSAGPDGFLNTNDDGAVEELVTPGPDGLLGTDDDRHKPLSGFTREIEIRDVAPNLRRLRVIVRYKTLTGEHSFTVVTFLSAYA